MKNLIYFSQATQPVTGTDLRKLLEHARDHNRAHDISGLLLYQAGYFLQALEGTAEGVQALYANIKRDKRHHKVTTIYDQEVDKRSFSGWHMGFHVVANESLQSCDGYTNVLSDEVPTNEIDLADEMTFCLVSLFKQYVRDEQQR